MRAWRVGCMPHPLAAGPADPASGWGGCIDGRSRLGEEARLQKRSIDSISVPAASSGRNRGRGRGSECVYQSITPYQS